MKKKKGVTARVYLRRREEREEESPIHIVKINYIHRINKHTLYIKTIHMKKKNNVVCEHL
jgi:hypothetical protein